MNEDLKAHLEFFEELGIDGVRLEPEWHARRELSEPTAPTEPAEPAAPTEPIRVFSSADDPLKAIRDDLGADCSRCKLHTLGRKQVVFGVGNPHADLMFVGEAPGAHEEIQGEPFGGRAAA